MRVEDDGKTLLRDVAIIMLNWEALKAILNAAQEEGTLKEIVTEKIVSYYTESEYRAEEPKKEYLSLVNYIKEPEYIYSLDILNAIKESCGLETFLRVIGENDRENIKAKLVNKNKDSVLPENKVMLNEVYQIEKSMAANKVMKVGIILLAL
ncbi:MAG: hypothetical protein ACR5KV_03725 [Wolbachia sp.]